MKYTSLTGPNARLPVVRFSGNGSRLIVGNARWGVDHPNQRRKRVGWRCQVPLALGWAMSTDDACGLTFEALTADLGHLSDGGSCDPLAIGRLAC